MKRTETIKDKKTFTNIIKDGKYKKDLNYVVYYIYKDNASNFSQFGIAIKKNIGKAFIRNKLKRQTRSIIDENKKMFSNKYNYIIMIRNGSINSKYSELNNSIINIAKGIK